MNLEGLQELLKEIEKVGMDHIDEEKFTGLLLDFTDKNCTTFDQGATDSEIDAMMKIFEMKVELVSKELNHFGGIASFFRDWAPGTLTGGP